MRGDNEGEEDRMGEGGRSDKKRKMARCGLVD